MKLPSRKVLAAALGLAIAASGPAAASATADIGWTQSGKLYEVRTWAGQAEPGAKDGKPAEASLFYPYSIAQLPDGKLLVADRGNHLIRTLTRDQLATYGGLSIGGDASGLPLGAYHDDKAPQAAFDSPKGVAVDGQGNVYVADSGNHAIRKIGKDGTVTTLAGNGLLGSDDGQGAKATFFAPSDVAADDRGNVYVADTLNHLIRKVAPDGTVTTLNAASTRVVQVVPGAVEPAGDFADGPIASAKFNEPSGLALDAKGNLFVSDRGNQTIRYIDFAAGTVTTVAGGTPTYAAGSLYAAGDYADGPAADARFYAPEGLAVAPDGTLVIADGLNHAVRLLKDGKVTTLAGEGGEYGASDGVLTAATFNHPTDVAVLSDGRLAIADENGQKVRILAKYSGSNAVTKDGKVKTLLNGVLLKTEAPALLEQGAVLLPLRSVGQALGYEVSFDSRAKSAKLAKGGVVYGIAGGQKKVVKQANGASSELVLNGAPVVRNGSLYVPVRFFAAEANLDIQWDGAVGTVVIRTPTF